MICLVCQLPNRTPERGQVCEPDRARIGRNLRDIGDLYQRIDLQPGRAAAGTRPTGKPGSRMPLAVDPLDLTMPGRVLGLAFIDSESYPKQQQLSDQIGHDSVASLLDSWVRDWRDHRGKGEKLPVPTALVLVDWLLKRYQEACDDHPAVDEFASEIKALHNAMRHMAGEIPPRPERLWVPCRGCNQLWMFRTAGEAYPISCEIDGCGLSYTEDEYATWTGLVAAQVKRGDFPPREPIEMVVIWHNTGELEAISA